MVRDVRLRFTEADGEFPSDLRSECHLLMRKPVQVNGEYACAKAVRIQMHLIIHGN